ncbi:hypothetical protein [Methanogenium cariaci]|uniref:hypothetical protein n=1 Tax=Methanogenium cariaci TaxID=2197 RepID=UPI00078168C9|nr:hypothetical protein [Methanogenium cariaci]
MIITLPPRHGKSEVVSKHYPPAWLLGRNPPDWEVIISSYSAELAHDFSRVARTALDQHGGDLWGGQRLPVTQQPSTAGGASKGTGGAD